MGTSIGARILSQLDYDKSGSLDRVELRHLVASVDPRNEELGPIVKDVNSLLLRGGGGRGENETLTAEQLQQIFCGLSQDQEMQLLHYVKRYKRRRKSLISKSNCLSLDIWILRANTTHLKENYSFGEILGSQGAFGDVFRATYKPTGQAVAVKRMSKSRLHVNGLLQCAVTEIETMQRISDSGGHKNLVGLQEVFEDYGYVYIAMEILEGGELFERMDHYRGKEQAAASVVAQLLKAVAFLHSLGIVHCDIKPENVLFEQQELRFDPTDNKAKCKEAFIQTYTDWEPIWKSAKPYLKNARKASHLKLIDFGISRHICTFYEANAATIDSKNGNNSASQSNIKVKSNENGNESKFKQKVQKPNYSKYCKSEAFSKLQVPELVGARGTIYYMAPEVISGSYSIHCDVWSIGVLMFSMLYGYAPFDYDEDDDSDECIFEKIKKGFQPVLKAGEGPWFNKDIWVSEEARHLLALLLESDPIKRLSASEALLCDWFGKTREAAKSRRRMVKRGLAEVRDMSSFRTFMLKLASSGHAYPFGPLHHLTEAASKGGTFSLQEVMEILDGDTRAETAHHAPALGCLSRYQSLRDTLENSTSNMEKNVSVEDLRLLVANCMLLAKEERLRSIFKSLDDSGDSLLDLKELTNALRCVGFNLSAKEIETMFEEIDLDDDGRVDYVEFLNALGMRHHRDMLRPRASSTLSPRGGGGNPKMQDLLSSPESNVSPDSKTSDSERRMSVLPYIYSPNKLGPLEAETVTCQRCQGGVQCIVI